MYIIKELKYKNILNIDLLELSDDTLSFITGESGSGKSTLLSLLMGVSSDFSGKIISKNNSSVGYLTTAHTFFKNTINEELDYICHLLDIKNTDYKYFLDLMCLEYSLDTNISILSSGEKQRLALARMLIANKQVLLLDEPTSALNKELERIIIDNLYNYANDNNIKLIVVTHNKELMNIYPSQKITIHNGEVIKNEL